MVLTNKLLYVALNDYNHSDNFSTRLLQKNNYLAVGKETICHGAFDNVKSLDKDIKGYTYAAFELLGESVESPVINLLQQFYRTATRRTTR